MLEINQQAFITKPEGIRGLYDRHAGMLLGYIYGVVKDRKLAEEYLIKVFSDLSQEFNKINWEKNNSWCQLQKFTRERLATFPATLKYFENPEVGKLKKTDTASVYLNRLTDEQRVVFSEVYYYGRSIAELSNGLNKTEDSIRKTLKEAFVIMRKGGEN